MQEVAEQPLAEFDVDAVGCVGQGVGAQVLQDDVEQPHRDDADREHDERRVALVAQHLVDHHLEEQRRHEGEELDEERGQQHVGQRSAVAPDRGQEPAEAEALRVVADAPDPAADEQQLRLDLAQELRRREPPIDAGDGVDDSEAPVRQPAAEDDETALAQHRDGGGGGRGELLLGGAGHPPRLQPDQTAGPHEVGDGGLAPDQGQFALEMDRVGGDPVIGGDPAERAEAGVGLGRRRERGGGLHHVTHVSEGTAPLRQRQVVGAATLHSAWNG